MCYRQTYGVRCVVRRTRRRCTIRHNLFLERLLNNWLFAGADEYIYQVPVHYTPPPFEDSGAPLEEGGTQAVPTTVLHAYIHHKVSGLFTVGGGGSSTACRTAEWHTGPAGGPPQL